MTGTMGKKRPRPADNASVSSSDGATRDTGNSTDTGSDSQMQNSDSSSLATPPPASPTAKDGAAAEKETEADPEEGLQEVMQDNLELMLDIIMRIREDPHFAKSIYADCPRLQHLLDQRPDLRPIFEDPRLVKITFEKAYKEAGGELPEEKNKSLMATVVNHPAFKFLRFLIMFKKIMNCVQGGGVSMIQDFFKDLFHHGHDHVVHGIDGGPDSGGGPDRGGPDGGDNDANADEDGNPENRESKDALNDAADRFEEPEMKEKLDHFKSIEDPEQLAEEIESDPEMRELRNSNELTSELMSDPDTCKIMLEPDNLRALSECPDLIEADISSPDWTPDSVDVDFDGGDGFDGDMDLDNTDGIQEGENVAAGADGLDGGVEGEAELEEEFEEEDEEEEEEEEDDDEDGEEEEEEEGLDYELGEEEMDDKNAPTKGKGGGAKKANPKSRAAQRQANQGNFFTNVAVGLSDMVAGEIVGASAGDITGGGDELDMLDGAEDYGDSMMDDLDDLEDAADGAADAAEAATLAENAALAAELVTDDAVADNLDNLEDGLDHVEDVNDEAQDKKTAAAAAGGGAVAAEKKNGETESKMAKDKELPTENAAKNRFRTIGKSLGGFMGSLATAAKEQVAASFLGDDIGEMLVEKMEEEDEEDESESDDDGSSKDDDGDDKSDVEKGNNKGKDDDNKKKDAGASKKQGDLGNLDNV